MSRMSRAFIFNEPQLIAASGLTLVNLVAYFKNPNAPLWLLPVCILFWPAIAYISNVVNPLPERKP